ncbi:hypothetical protein D9Q98_009460 [Chlorella vulgaris]|uniref:FAS1 domain-containing protein n=1 Tax=Chlorella vulgaris TaxID=3077 RepID=A0A9D4TF96_CHLVU|nr:hypothetical protein D9Q98_009460 [Chlorella vulgaris]
MTPGRSKALFFASLGWLLAPLAAQARVLAQTAEPNPFLPTPGSSPSLAAAPLPPILPAAAAPLAPAPPASAPVAEYDPCACTTTGFSAGLNTNTVGCGQHELVAGSAAFSCFINDPRLCLQDVPLTPSQFLPGAASRQCSEQEAQAYLPRVSTLIVNTPQLISFANALRQANLSSIPGTQVTIFAPSNQAFSAAKANGVLTPEQLQDPALLKQLILASIVPRRLTAADLLSAGSVTAEGGQQLPVASPSAGQLMVGAGRVLLPDVLASNGVIHITDGWVWLPPPSAGG